jgi:uncharacterized protein (TIGR03435 family)
MLAAILRTGLALLIGGLAFGQAADKSLTFDAASVKPSTPPTPNGRGMIRFEGPSGGPGSKDPGRIRYPFMSLKDLITRAYDVKPFQVTGPVWLDTERFDITATMPAETTKEQFRVMLQNLLAERFKLTVHHETKELPMYSLVVLKGGPKMTESAPVAPPKETDGDPTPPPALPPGGPKMGPDGFPILPAGLMGGGRGGMFIMMMPGRMRLTASQQTMKDVADNLTSRLSRPVTDATELKGKYDFVLTFSPEGLSNGMGPMGLMPPPPGGGGGAVGDGGGRGPMAAQPDAEPLPDIFRAIQSQLGLKLEPKKGPVDMVIVDHMEKTATEN